MSSPFTQNDSSENGSVLATVIVEEPLLHVALSADDTVISPSTVVTVADTVAGVVVLVVCEGVDVVQVKVLAVPFFTVQLPTVQELAPFVTTRFVGTLNPEGIAAVRVKVLPVPAVTAPVV